MGTSYSITLVDPPAPLSLDILRLDIEAELEYVEALTSTYRPDSELSRLNRDTSTDWIHISAALCDILSAAIEISQQTDGAFDPTIGPLVNLWGFGAVDRKAKIPTPLEIRDAMPKIGFTNVVLDCAQSRIRKVFPGMFVDLSGWAKGFAVDRVAHILDRVSVENYLVEIGGELRVKGHNGEAQLFVIGIEQPTVGEASVNTLFEMTDIGVATSGDYRNFFVQDGIRYSHTIDPATGWPVNHNLVSVTVFATSVARADALATALLVLGPESGMAMADEHDIAAYFIIVTPSGTKTLRSKALLDLERNMHCQEITLSSQLAARQYGATQQE